MKKNIIAFIIIIVIFGLIGTFSSLTKAPTTTNQQNNNQQSTEADKQTKITYSGEEGKTALELLKKQTTVETKTSGELGEYVVTINGLPTAAEAGKYWLFYVNGQMATVGADKYQTKTIDTIEWRLE
ncbi:MAG: hypothetical protein CEN88_285 [Candidatus Berkelbacteria bacterium Licking1014_2]|uniref:Transcobalamin-like C-terminal domain-containing protein n=1 Tax=Candidatus Berkelbacteria bacterium Licking1014_2 TaxID=2017146 RepID=A0A554LV54_9BACT|nr:MAG: hypothetical protein CEN88_285 [Candidatus Berkelbacteria bacterium Licking1014_2]